MGQDGYFKSRLDSIIRSAKSLKFTTPEGNTITGYTNILRYIRKKGYTSEDVPEFSRIRNMIDIALSEAKNRVYNRISTANEVNAKEMNKNQRVYSGENMDLDNIDRLLQLNNSN